MSRYENFTRMPNALTIFACEIVFNQPSSELFAGCYEAIRRVVQERARKLLKKLQAQPDVQARKTIRKIERFRAIVEAKPTAARHG